MCFWSVCRKLCENWKHTNDQDLMPWFMNLWAWAEFHSFSSFRAKDGFYRDQGVCNSQILIWCFFTFSEPPRMIYHQYMIQQTFSWCSCALCPLGVENSEQASHQIRAHICSNSWLTCVVQLMISLVFNVYAVTAQCWDNDKSFLATSYIYHIIQGLLLSHLTKSFLKNNSE